MRDPRWIVVGIASVGCVALVGATGCFGSSSGGPGPGVDFGDSGTLDDFSSGDTGNPADSTTPVDSGADTSTPVDAPADTTSPPVDAAQDTTAPLDAGSDSTAPGTDGGDAGIVAGALIRLANMAAVQTSVDFCIQPQGGAFAGPYMASKGVAAGVGYAQMSEYAPLLAASSFTVRVVQAGASSCAAWTYPDVTTGPSIPSNPTTVVFGAVDVDGSIGVGLAPYVDDPPGPQATPTQFRAFNEAPGVATADFQIGVTPYVYPIQAAVPYGGLFSSATVAPAAVAPPAPDAQGYVAVSLYNEEITVVIGGVETLSYFVSADDGSVYDSNTAFLIGVPGSPTNPLAVVSCDEDAAISGHLSACTSSANAPTTVPLRILHGAPDQSAIDVCGSIGPEPYGPQLVSAGGVMGGLTFLQMSGDLTLVPAHTDFNLAFVDVGQPCATSGFLVLQAGAINAAEYTVVVNEDAFPPSPSYSAVYFDTGDLDVNPNAAPITVVNAGAAPGLGIIPYGTEMGMAEQALSTFTLNPYSQVYTTIAAGTYALRVANAANSQTVYSKSGVVFAPGQYFLPWLTTTSATTGVLAVCPLGSHGANQVTTCTD